MARFADPPYFILDNYWGLLIPYNYTYPNTARLIGPMSGIVAEGGYGDDLYIKTSTEFKKCRFLPNSTHVSGNHFLLHKVSPSASEFDAGDEVYFRKDSYFHDYVTNNSTWKDDFINVNKWFLYFGKIYPTSTAGQYIVIFDGLKDYTLRSLPVHNRTAKVEELLYLYFDKIYHEIYNRMKNIWTLHDPIEIESTLLNYITRMYNMVLNEDLPLTEIKQRQYVKNIIYELKRKGTYSSLYIIWKTILFNTTNNLYIYELWHDWMTPLSLDTFEGHKYTEFSSYSTSASDYPTYSEYTSGGKYLSTHYDIEADFSNQPEGDDYIINETLITNLYEQWEELRPVTRVAHYYEKISPLTDFTQTYTSLYSSIYPAYMKAKSCVAVPSTEIHLQSTATSAWTVEHGFPSKEVLVQFFDEDYNQIFPDTVNFSGDSLIDNIITDNDSIDLEDGFGDWKSYSAYITRVDSVVTVGTGSSSMGASGDTCLSIESSGSDGSALLQLDTVESNVYRVDFLYFINDPDVTLYAGVGNTEDPTSVTDWNMFSTRNKWTRATFTFTALANMYLFLKSGSNGNIVYADDFACIIFNDPPTIIATFPTTVSGIAAVAEYDYLFSTPASGDSTWTMLHSLNTTPVLSQYMDSDDDKIIPLNVDSSNANTTIATFGSDVIGDSTILSGQYLHIQTVSSTTWTILHNLNTQVLLAQFFDASYERIVPLSLVLADRNTCTATFESAVDGYAKIEDIGNLGSKDNIVTSCASSAGGYVKLGTGGGPTWYPAVENDVETVGLTSGRDITVTQDNDYYYLKAIIRNDTEINFTEFGFFDVNNNIMFYSYHSPIYKIEQVYVNILLRIRK